MYLWWQSTIYNTLFTFHSQLLWRWVEGFDPEGMATFTSLDFVPTMMNLLLVQIAPRVTFSWRLSFPNKVRSLNTSRLKLTDNTWYGRCESNTFFKLYMLVCEYKEENTVSLFVEKVTSLSLWHFMLIIGFSGAHPVLSLNRQRVTESSGFIRNWRILLDLEDAAVSKGSPGTKNKWSIGWLKEPSSLYLILFFSKSHKIMFPISSAVAIYPSSLLKAMAVGVLFCLIVKTTLDVLMLRITISPVFRQTATISTIGVVATITISLLPSSTFSVNKLYSKRSFWEIGFNNAMCWLLYANTLLI